MLFNDTVLSVEFVAMESVYNEIANLSSSHGIFLKGLSATSETSVSLSALRHGIDLHTS
jgi:hypothetical protein